MQVEPDFYFYAISPIDYGWEQMASVREHAKRIIDDSYDLKSAGEEIAELGKFVDKALKHGSDHGWEGDFRIEPHVFVMPGEVSCSVGVMWKQDNNGETFVASKVRLPWLDSLDWRS